MTSATTTGAPEVPPEFLAQIEAARTLCFGAMLSLLRTRTDSAIVAGVLIDCLAHLLASRPPAARDDDLQQTLDTLRTRVSQIAAAIPPHPSMH